MSQHQGDSQACDAHDTTLHGGGGIVEPVNAERLRTSRELNAQAVLEVQRQLLHWRQLTRTDHESIAVMDLGFVLVGGIDER